MLSNGPTLSTRKLTRRRSAQHCVQRRRCWRRCRAHTPSDTFNSFRALKVEQWIYKTLQVAPLWSEAALLAPLPDSTSSDTFGSFRAWNLSKRPTRGYMSHRCGRRRCCWRRCWAQRPAVPQRAATAAARARRPPATAPAACVSPAPGGCAALLAPSPALWPACRKSLLSSGKVLDSIAFFETISAAVVPPQTPATASAAFGSPAPGGCAAPPAPPPAPWPASGHE